MGKNKAKRTKKEDKIREKREKIKKE